MRCLNLSDLKDIDIDSWGKTSRGSRGDNHDSNKKITESRGVSRNDNHDSNKKITESRGDKTTRKKSPGKYEILKKEFEEFKQEIFQKIENLQEAKTDFDLPEETHNEFKVLALQFARKYAHTKRYWFINKDYAKGLNPSNNEPDKIAYERLIELSKPKKKEKDEKK